MNNEVFFFTKEQTKKRSTDNIKSTRKALTKEYFLAISNHRSSSHQAGSHNFVLTLSPEAMRTLDVDCDSYVLIGIVNNLILVKKSNEETGWKVSVNKVDKRGYGRVKVSHRGELPIFKKVYNQSETLMTTQGLYFELMEGEE